MEITQLRKDALAILKAALPTTAPSAAGEAILRHRYTLYQCARILINGSLPWK